MKSIIVLSVLFMITICPNLILGKPPTGPTNFVGTKANRAITKAVAALTPVSRRFEAGANPAAYRCAAKCDQDLQNATDSILPWRLEEEGEQNEDHETWAIFDTDKMTGICQAFNETERCLDRCPESEMKTNLKKRYIIRKFECQESTCVHTADCAMIVANLDNNCTLRNRSENEQDIKETLKDLCQYMKTLFDCSKELLVQRCGQGAANDWYGWIKKYAEYRKNDLTDKGLAHFYPRECDQV